jgi:hypothetical protein
MYRLAPTASSGGDGKLRTKEWPQAPAKPLGFPAKPPVFRPLKIYAFGPSLGRARGNIRTINVRYEKLAPGPVGERIAVVDYDRSRDCFYDPVDLDDPLIAINGGVEPSESDPHFHQQMVYAVASETLRRIEVALGRTVKRRSPQGAAPLRLTIYPHGAVTANSFGVDDGRIVLGYFRATEKATGRTLPGQTVFTCLSHDVIAHVTTTTILSAMRPDLKASRSGNEGSATFAVAMSDLTALLFHFTHRDVVLDTIHRTAGIIYQSQLETEREPAAGGARILAELASNNPLLALGQDFGEAMGRVGGLRSALTAPDPTALERTLEPHGRAEIMVAAVFDALFSIYQRRTIDLFRIYRAGGGRVPVDDVPEPLAARLCDEVERIVNRVFNMCWRALDYCPPVHLALGDVLRACITADYEYTPDDAWGLRDAMMQAFRLRGIKPSTAAFFSEDTLRWPPVDTGNWTRAALDLTRLSDGGGDRELRQFIDENASALGFTDADLAVFPLETARLTSPNDVPQTTWSTQLLSKDAAVTLVFDSGGRLRYAIPSSPVGPPASASTAAPRPRKPAAKR